MKTYTLATHGMLYRCMDGGVVRFSSRRSARLAKWDQCLDEACIVELTLWTRLVDLALRARKRWL